MPSSPLASLSWPSLILLSPHWLRFLYPILSFSLLSSAFFPSLFLSLRPSSYCLPHPWAVPSLDKLCIGDRMDPPHPHCSCVCSAWLTHPPPTGKQSSTSQCQVAISQGGQSLCTFPVFFPKNNLRKDDTANQLLICFNVLQRASKSSCFLEKRKIPGPHLITGMQDCIHCHLFPSSLLPIPQPIHQVLLAPPYY